MGLPIIGLVGSVIEKVFGVVDKAVPDKDMREKLKAEIQTQLMLYDLKELESKSAIIIAEAQGDSWLQRSWRPILMLTFGALIVARWMGWVAPNLSEAEYTALWDIIQLGLGGYVIGRSAEKIAPAVADAMKRKS